MRRRFAVPREMHAVERTRRLLAAAVDYPVPDGAGRYGIAVAGLGIASPHAISTIVPQYLETFRPKGQYSHYRG